MDRPDAFLSRRRAPLVAGVAALLVAIASSGQASGFDDFFTGRTLRFDYFHSGTFGEEHISVDRLRLEGDWPGRRNALLDDTNLGQFLFEVVDPQRNVVLYSQGFSSIYREWETTGEARRGVWRTFHESQRFPEPRQPVQLVLKKRSADGTFRELFTQVVDPTDRFVDRSPLVPRGTAWPVFENGSPETKVDLLILGDGYTEAELELYRSDAKAVAEALFSFPPFSRHKEQFNVWAIDVTSDASGVTRPRGGYWNDTPIGLSYNAFDSERYMLSFENRRMREIAALAPYDHLILIANDEKYGGGGIFNLYSTAAARSAQMPYLIVHEFGHAFAGLADEYYTSSVSYEDFNPPGTEPWEPNATALLDPENLKWRELVEDGTPLPTPWNQDTYDRLSLDFQKRRNELRSSGASEKVMDEYFDEVKAATSKLLEAEPYYDQVGAFEGASYQARGLYRPGADCIMFTRNPETFCPVCSMAIERIIRLYTR